MRKVTGFILLLAILAIIMTPLAYAEDAKKTVVNSNNMFAFDLYKKLGSEKQGENLFFSPYSISTAMAMAYIGARGKTSLEMQKVLYYPTPEETLNKGMQLLINDLGGRSRQGNYQLNIANRMWIQEKYQVRPAYQQAVQKFYMASVGMVNFAGNPEGARKVINQWVEQKTNKKIQNLIPENVLKPTTRLVLTNAIYFMGNWAMQFDEKQTRDAEFTAFDGTKVTTPFMHRSDNYNYFENESYQAVLLPYKSKDGNELGMAVLLPRKTDGLTALEQQMKASIFTSIIAKMESQKVDVYLPKFKMMSSFNLSETLKQMGMPLAFSLAADFTGIGRDLYIQAVLHKAFVEVNERGTEAAAATAVVIGVKSAPVRSTIFRADHPFLFAIYDQKTGSVLFLGRMMNPKK